MQVKEPYSGLHDYLQDESLQNLCVHYTPAHNLRERIYCSVFIERKKEKSIFRC